MRNARWLRLLAYVTGSVNQELLARNEYLATENRILRAKLPSRLRLSNSERTTLAEIGKRWDAKRSAKLPLWPNRIPSWRGDLFGQRGALNKVHDKVVGANIVQRTNIGVIERCDRAGFALEPFAKALWRDLDGYLAAQTGVPGAVDLTHAASADGR